MSDENKEEICTCWLPDGNMDLCPFHREKEPPSEHGDSPRQNELPLSPREWLLQGGGGFEDGEDGLRAATFSGEGAIDLLEAYREYLQGAAPVTPKSWELVHDRVVRGHRQVIEELIRHLEYFGAYLLPPHLDAIASAKRIIADDPLNVDARPLESVSSPAGSSTKEEDSGGEATVTSKAANETPQNTKI